MRIRPPRKSDIRPIITAAAAYSEAKSRVLACVIVVRRVRDAGSASIFNGVGVWIVKSSVRICPDNLKIKNSLRCKLKFTINTE